MELELTVTGSEVVLTVDDNGVGISAAGRRSGLVNLQKRAELLGGSLQIGRQPSGGTRLEWRAPVGDAEPVSPGPAAVSGPLPDRCSPP